MTTPFTDEEHRFLPEELLSLPEQLATLTSNVNSFIEQQLATNARFEAFCDSMVQRLTALDGERRHPAKRRRYP